MGKRKHSVPSGPHDAKGLEGTHKVWYYVERGKIIVVAELRPAGQYVGTTQAVLTQAQLESALAAMQGSREGSGS